MVEVIKFRLGMICVSIEGHNPAVFWAVKTFNVLECKCEPHLKIVFTSDPIKNDAVNAVGDGGENVSAQTVSFKTRHFDVRFSEERSVLCCTIFQRDRRSLLVRSLLDLEEAWKVWLSHCGTLDIHPLKEFAYSILPSALQYTLIKHGGALIHAGAFTIGGKGILLPAWGGVGKSTLVSRSVLHGTGSFIADDHAVVSEDGNMHLYTLPIHLYSYHLKNDNVLRERALSNFSFLNRAQLPLGSLLRPRRAVRWIAPQSIYTESKLARASTIDQVIVMFRGNTEKFIWKECSPEEAAIPSAGIILREITGFSDRLALGSAGWEKGPLPDLADSCRRIQSIYKSAFSSANCAKLLIPRAAKAKELIDFVKTRSGLMKEALQTE